MEGPKASLPDGRSTRDKLVHSLAERMQIILSSVDTLKLRLRGTEDVELLRDLEAATHASIKLFEELRHT